MSAPVDARGALPTQTISAPSRIVDGLFQSLRLRVCPEGQRQTSGDGRKASVLILQELPDLGYIMEFLLGAKGYRAFYRPHSPEGISYARQFRPQVILLNLGAPVRCRGLETCKTLRSLPETAGCAIAMMTVEDRDKYGRAAFEAGATILVGTDLHPNTLVKIVEDALKANE